MAQDPPADLASEFNALTEEESSYVYLLGIQPDQEVAQIMAQHPTRSSDDDADEEDDLQEEEEEVDDTQPDNQAEGEGVATVDPDDDDEEEAHKKYLYNISQAKSMVSLSRKPSGKAAYNANTSGGSARKKGRVSKSKVWDYCFVAKIKDGLRDDLERLDPIAVELLDKPHYYCCQICYDDELKPLHLCLKSGSKSNDGPGNLNVHMKSHDDVAHLFDAKIAAQRNHELARRKASKESIQEDNQPAPKASLKRRRPETANGSVAEDGSTLSDPSEQGNTTTAGTTTGNSSYARATYPIRSDLPSLNLHPQFVTVKETARKKVLRGYHERAFFFANQNSIPQRAIVDPNCPEFRDLIDYCCRNGRIILEEPPRTRHLSWRGFSSIRTDKYCEVVAGVDMICEEARDFFLKELKILIPFISVAHDIWDAHSKECLGLTIHMYCPPRQIVYRIPLGLERSLDKHAEPTAAQGLAILEAAGIGKDDIYRAANDTTNAALMAGRLMTAEGDEGTCLMHITQLCIDHATGRKKRSQNKQITDSFDECEAIRLASLKASKTVWDKKSKKKWDDYSTVMKSCARMVTKILQPNKTRASGVRLHYEGMVRARWNLDLYWFKKSITGGLSNEQFLIVAQLWSVLYPIGILAFEIQTDDVGALSYSFLYYFRCFVLYATKKRWWVPDVCKSHNTDDESHWNGNATFPELSYNGDPVGVGAGASILNGTMQKIQMLATKTEDLHAVPTQLAVRLCKELKSYGGSPTRDQLLAMGCNPFTATLGMQELSIHGMVLQSDESVDDDTKTLAKDFKAMAMDELEKEVKKICEKIIPTTPPPSDSEEEATTDLSLMEKLRLKMEREAAAKHAAQDNAKDTIRREVEQFFSQRFDPVAAIQKQNKKVAPNVLKKIGSTPSQWMANWPTIVRNLDVFDWWERQGKTLFPHIYYVACCILPLPDSNGHQERTFSTATWMDGKLQQRTKDMTFQQKVVVAKNKSFLEHNDLHVKVERRGVAEQRTKDLLMQSATLLAGADEADTEEVKSALMAMQKDTGSN